MTADDLYALEAWDMGVSVEEDQKMITLTMVGDLHDEDGKPIGHYHSDLRITYERCIQLISLAQECMAGVVHDCDEEAAE